MWKKYLPLVVAVLIIPSGMLLYRHRHRLFRPDFARTGGTQLVFALAEPASPQDLLEAVGLLEKRLDPVGKFGILVRVTDDGKVAFDVPAGRHHDEQVEMIRRTAGRTGKLEFRFYAMTGEDDEAIQAARAQSRKPGPKDTSPADPKNGQGTNEFSTTTSGEQRYRYAWARLSESEMKGMHLKGPGAGAGGPVDPERVKRALGTGETFSTTTFPRNLFAARLAPGSSDPILFVLTRIEPTSQEIRREHVERARLTSPREFGRAGALLRFTPEGGVRLYEMTHPHVVSTPDPNARKKIAFLLDGEVQASMMLFQTLRAEAHVAGNFTDEEASDLAALIRGGTLPIRLVPKPDLEKTVPPRK